MSTLSWLSAFVISTASILYSPPEDQVSDACELNVSLELAPQATGTQVKVLVEEKGDYSYYFYTVDKKLVSEDFKSNVVTINNPGDYVCVVVKDIECHTKIEFEI